MARVEAAGGKGPRESGRGEAAGGSRVEDEGEAIGATAGKRPTGGSNEARDGRQMMRMRRPSMPNGL